MGKIKFPSQITLGLTFFVTINIVIKFVVYPFAIHLSNNTFVGLVLMFLFSIIIRYLLLYSYDLIKIDWLLIENLKAKKEYKDNHITRRIKKLKAIGKITLLLVLMITDPVVLVIYFRQGYFEWNGIKGFNLKILFVISNLMCVIITGGAITIIFEIF